MSPTKHLCTVMASECLTTLPLKFSQKKFVADFLRQKCSFILKTATAFLKLSPPPPQELRGNVRCSSQARCKARGNELHVLR